MLRGIFLSLNDFIALVSPNPEIVVDGEAT